MDDPSTLENVVKTFEDSLDSLSFWLSVSTLLVVLGLVVEYWHDVRDLIILRPFNWKLFLTIIGGALITVGVAGELFIQVKASGVEGRLRAANHQAVAILEKEAAGARKEAETAHKEAASFDVEIAKANKGAADAIERAAKAEESLGQARRDAALAEQHAGEANRVAEQERLERVKIQERMADRHLSQKQQAAVAARLNQFPKQIVNLLIYSTSSDVGTIGSDMIATLVSSGWEPHTFLGQEGNRVVRGILVEISPQATDETNKAASALVDALRAQRLLVKGPSPRPGTTGMFGTGNTSPDAKIHITIGNKPE